LVGVEVNHDCCLPLHAHNGDEKIKLINNKVMEAIVKKSVEKEVLILVTHIAQPTFENGGAWVM
jgi:hypothetical protein